MYAILIAVLFSKISGRSLKDSSKYFLKNSNEPKLYPCHFQYISVSSEGLFNGNIRFNILFINYMDLLQLDVKAFEVRCLVMNRQIA